MRAELEELGFAGVRTEDRRVYFDGTAEDLARANLWLRAADRVLIRLAEFACTSFDELYGGLHGIPWVDFLAPRAALTVAARSVKAKLSSVPAIQSVAKKAIIDAVSGTRSGGRVEETGPAYGVEVVLHEDRASVCLDTTGPGLHKRGYRTGAGEAPLRENLAAALVLLSRWDPRRPFADPFCGSGTIAIEAALLARRIAPGISRRFAAEEWPHIPPDTWRRAREDARAAERRDVALRIAASDRDGKILETARGNARKAGVADCIAFHRAEIQALDPTGEFGCMVCNPPYAERLGERREVEDLYRAMGRLHRRLDTWSIFVLTAHPEFQKFFGVRASKNRKLYNGNLKCYFYQYYGPLPRAL